jgi:hypothetical protein
MLGDHCLGGLGLEGAILGAQAAFAWTEKHVVLKKMIKK